MTSKAPLFDTLDEPGVFDWGVGFAAALACHLAAPRSWETPFAAQLAEAWPELHASGGAFHDPVVTRLRYLTAAQAAQATNRWILLQATKAAEPAFSPDLDPNWIANLTDHPTAHLAANLCQQAVDRLRELDRWTADDWTAATVASCAREQYLNRVTAKPAIPLGELKYRLAALWTARLESAPCSQEYPTLPDPLVTNFQNLFLEYYLQLLNLRLQTPGDELRHLQHEMQERLSRTPIPRALQHRQPTTPRWAQRYLTRLQWLNQKGLAFINSTQPLTPLTEEEGIDITRDANRLLSTWEWMHDYFFVARRLPNQHALDWQLLLGDRQLESSVWLTQTLESQLPAMVPAAPAEHYDCAAFVQWLADLIPSSVTIELLFSWLQSGNSQKKRCAALPLAVLAPTSSTRECLENLVIDNHHYDEYLAEHFAHALAMVWPDDKTRALLSKIVKDLHLDSGIREAAVQFLAQIWIHEDIRPLLEEVAANFEDYENKHSTGIPRQTAMEILAGTWPDPQTRALLENIIQNDDNYYTKHKAEELLMLTWPPPTDRASIEALLDTPDSGTAYPEWDLLESLAAGWPDQATRRRLIGYIAPDSDHRTVDAAIAVLANHWTDPEFQSDLIEALTLWLSQKGNAMASLNWSWSPKLQTILTPKTHRALFELHPDRNGYLLAKFYPDERTRRLLQEGFINDPKSFKATLLARTFPDESTRRFLIKFGLNDDDAPPENLFNTLLALALHWPDDAIRKQIEASLLDPHTTDHGILIAAYRAFTHQAEAKSFLFHAMLDLDDDRVRSQFFSFIQEQYKDDRQWLHGFLMAVAHGDLGENIECRWLALNQLAQSWPTEETRILVEDIASQADSELPSEHHSHPIKTLRIVARQIMASVWPDERTLDLLRDIEKRGLVLPSGTKDFLKIATETQGLLASFKRPTAT